MGKYGTKNHVSLNPADASIIFLGQPKIGKTTLMKEVAEKLVGEDYLFLEMYREKGHRYIEGIIAEPIETWSKFEDVVSDIEENKASEYPNLKVIFIDTWDNAILLAEQEVIRLYNKENPDGKVKTINAAYGGFQRGQKRAAEMLNKMIDRLQSVGVKVDVIMHVKNKTIVDVTTEKEYNQLTADAAQTYFNAIKMNFDVIAVGYIDREIVTEKTGRKDIKNNDITRKAIKSETRKIKFRDTGYAIDAGGRLKYIVEEIPFEADAFISAVKTALEKEVEAGGVSLSDRKKEDVKREKAALKQAEENSAKAVKFKFDEDENEELINQIKAFYPDASDSAKAKVKEIMAEYEIENFKSVEVSTEGLKLIVKELSKN